MSRKSTRGLSAVLRYTGFDLANLQLRTWLSLVGMPVVLLVVGVVFLGSFELARGPGTVVLVVTAHPEEQEGLRGVLDYSEIDEVRVVAELPDDVNARVEAGEIAVVAELGPRVDGLRAIRAWGPASFTVPPDKVEQDLERWWGDQLVTLRAGPEPEVVRQRETGGAEASVEVDLPLLETRGVGRVGLGLFCVGLLSTLLGLVVGAKVAESGREGFNMVLSLGTSRRAIYVSEMLTGSLLVAVQAAAWVGVYGVVLGMVAGRMSGTLPLASELAGDLGVLALCSGVALIQACCVGCTTGMVQQDVHPTRRQRIRSMFTLPMLVGTMAYVTLATPKLIAATAAVPVVGPMALWYAHVRGWPGVWGLLALQGVYAVVALELGSRVFALGESPVDWAWRRVRRR